MSDKHNSHPVATGTTAEIDETKIIREQARKRRGGGPMGPMHGPADKSDNFWPSAKKLVVQLRPERFNVMTVIAVGIISIVLSVLGPAVLGKATDIIWDGFRAGTGVDFSAVGVVLLWMLGLYIVSAVFAALQGFILNGVTQRTVYRLRSKVERKLHTLPLSYFDRMQRGEVLSRVTNDIDNISQTLQQTMSQMLTSLLTVVGVVVMMFVISPALAAISLITIPLTIVVTTLVARRSQKLFVAQWTTTGRLNAHVEEAYSGHALVRVFGRRREVVEEFDKENESLYSSSFGAQFVSGLIMPAMTFIGNFIYVAIAVVGGFMVAAGSITLGSVQAFIQYSRQFTQPLTQLGSMANLLQSGVASAERVFELLDAEEQSPDPVEDTQEEAAATSSGRLVFDTVSFRYDKDTPLIDNLSFEAEPGQTIAIVGPTGAGKTTVVNLIMRFYEIDGGRITLDGRDTATMSREQLRSHIGMVLQETWLFSGTIRENIFFGRPEATEAEMLAVAQASYVDRFVIRLPDGYDTVLDDDASSLSAGEKQLVTIARAMLSNPTLLILDEATSSVDTRTELLLQNAMIAIRGGRTSFVIAHRLSTIRDADLILVMEEGHIVEQGTHSELISRSGAYARLYEAQFSTGSQPEN